MRTKMRECFCCCCTCPKMDEKRPTTPPHSSHTRDPTGRGKYAAVPWTPSNRASKSAAVTGGRPSPGSSATQSRDRFLAAGLAMAATARAATHSRSGARPVEDRRSSSLTPSERLFFFFFFFEGRSEKKSSRRRRFINLFFSPSSAPPLSFFLDAPEALQEVYSVAGAVAGVGRGHLARSHWLTKRKERNRCNKQLEVKN